MYGMQNSVYAHSARFDVNHQMTEDEMHRIAPSIFATEAHESRSERFAPIPTIEVLRALTREGFAPVGVKQSKTSDETRRETTKHLIRLRRVGTIPGTEVKHDLAEYRVGDTVCEIILKNANDGSSTYDLMAGLFKIRCMNSLVAQTGTLDTVKVKHQGDVASKVIEGTYRVLGEAQKALAAPQDWSKIILADRDQRAFAEAAHVLRFGDSEGNVTTPIKPVALLTTRRREDIAADVWTTFNVVQENVIRGGLHGTGRDANNRIRHTTSRAVHGIDQDVRLNKALWILAAKMAELKSAA
jgi:hypothetical protein